jgi:hypothetical protein
MKKTTKLRKKIGEFLQKYRSAILAIFGIAAVLALYLVRLGHPAAVSAAGKATYVYNSSWQHFLLNPLYGPYRIVDEAFVHIFPHSIFAARLAAALWATLGCVLFFVIIKRWHGTLQAVLAGMLFATTAWMLHTGRISNSIIILSVFIVGLLFAAVRLNSSKRPDATLPLGAAIFGVGLFIPGGIWFELAAIILLRKKITRQFREASFFVQGSSILLLAILVGALAATLSFDEGLFHTWLAIPANLPNIGQFFLQWGQSLSYLFVRGPFMPGMWLGHMPVLSSFGSVMFLLGVYFYIRHFRNSRAQMLFTFFIIGSLLVGLNGAAAMSFLVPLAYMFIATGISYFLRLWQKTFPRNPIARGTAIGLILAAVILVAIFHTLGYFVAWPNSPDTKATLTHQLQ